MYKHCPKSSGYIINDTFVRSKENDRERHDNYKKKLEKQNCKLYEQEF